ncbi:hypothetical protein [Actinoplanes palleronii]|uniref:C2H2-type domain-containing protein n=1 Tax=Actinoplanes palleronii TaxID=113570 RepID=A0ABQ4BI87_9ACTN|nr:hypothetical protein [Actinoplanes palleronii]GIE70335.1 hypothetical protein Apa02nite_064430 [Actinoplanes palleronii]
MATCNLCRRDMSDDEVDGHRRDVHPDISADGTRESDDSRIMPDAAAESIRPPDAAGHPRAAEDA